MRISALQFPDLDRFFRGNLLNSLTGFKSLSLLGTLGENDQPNLAVFTQIFHMGADPALIGVLFRPVVPGMHSLDNIRRSGCFTLSHVPADRALEAHWTSARWEESEFDAVGLHPGFHEGFPAPFVEESPIRLGLTTAQILPIPLNGTTLVIGKVEWVEFPEDCLGSDGFVNLQKAGILAGTGLDGYARVSEIQRFAYARPGQKPQALPV